jgi:carbon storage regulator
MLYLTRKTGESIVINDTIEVTVVEVRGRAVKLGFTFPADATVLRKEIHEKILRENLEAARASEALAEDALAPEALAGLLPKAKP